MSVNVGTHVAGDDGGHAALDKVMRLLEDRLDEGDATERANPRPDPDDIFGVLCRWRRAVSEPPADVGGEAGEAVGRCSGHVEWMGPAGWSSGRWADEDFSLSNTARIIGLRAEDLT